LNASGRVDAIQVDETCGTYACVRPVWTSEESEIDVRECRFNTKAVVQGVTSTEQWDSMDCIVTSSNFDDASIFFSLIHYKSDSFVVGVFSDWKK
jgi:hypothetical protein